MKDKEYICEECGNEFLSFELINGLCRACRGEDEPKPTEEYKVEYE